jgi:glycosyltransferase involved in cell wall biosynthesis
MKLSILGIRGIPANHGGFETFAEKLALYLTERGWDITVYCQLEGNGATYEDTWCGIRRVNIPVKQRGALGTIVFDWKSTLHAADEDSLKLTLGYNTASFSLLYRLKGRTNIFNMDGIEWKRKKWRLPEKLWLMLNEICGCYLGNHLIADHPGIKEHLETRVSGDKISVLLYGSHALEHHEHTILDRFGVEPGKYALVVARPEPENSILEIVRAFSQSDADMKMVVLGNYNPQHNDYHREVLDVASDSVIFPGAVYESDVINALRYHCKLYIHGHTVGGTNPSLVEALGAGSPVLAHDNQFNRWVVGDGGAYFSNEAECREQITELVQDNARLGVMSKKSISRHREEFTWSKVLEDYENLLYDWHRKIVVEIGSSVESQQMSNL